MTPAFDKVHRLLKKLPGLGHRSAERLALHLLVEKPESLEPLLSALQEAESVLRRCARCGNVAEGEFCVVCSDVRRDSSVICVVEQVPDLVAVDRSGVFPGQFHVLHGKLSPINGVGPAELNLESLRDRLGSGEVSEVILALSNDIEGEATCHYIQEILVGEAFPEVTVTRIGFGLPSGAGIVYADPATMKNALQGRRNYE